jgi:Leucine-rich repeat (LRR) protein
MLNNLFLLVLFILLLTGNSYAQSGETYVPDNAFEQALIDLGYDDVLDDYVVTDSVSQIADLTIFNNGISSLEGIEDFEGLETLNCANNLITNLDLSYNLNLIELNCSSNSIEGANLKVSGNTNLKKLFCSDNLITNLNLTENMQLEALEFTNNLIVTIDLSQNDSLKTIKASNNRLTSLNISAQIGLEELEASKNQLKALDVNSNKILKNLLISSNQITDLDLKEKDSLIFLDISNNQLAKVELNTSHILTNLTASDNKISTLNLTNLDSLHFLGVSDNKLNSLDISNNLKLENLFAGNNQLKQIDLNKNLYLKEINLVRNLITSIDLDNNDSITAVDLSFNQLTNFNPSKNTLMKRINVSHNQISALDFSAHDSLNSVICSYNKLTQLQLNNGNNEVLETLVTNGNDDLFCIQIDDIDQIGDFWLKDDHSNYYDGPNNFGEACRPYTFIPDVNFEKELINLGIDTNTIPDNYVLTSAISKITELDISRDSIVNLSGLKDFISLEKLDCSNNFIVSLETSMLANLGELNASGNLLTSLYVKENNIQQLDATGNPGLNCIIVNDIDAALKNVNWAVDDAGVYKLECSTDKTYLPDDQFEQALIELGLDTGPLDDYVYTAAVKNVQLLELQKKNIFDLTGIKAFKSLQSLNCSENNLNKLDLSENLELLRLVCFNNNLSELDISKNSLLIELNIGNNEIDALDVSMNLNLLELVADKNNLRDLDVDDNLNLRILNINSNYISRVDLVDKNTLLTEFLCASNEFRKIDISKNTALIKFDCSNNFVEQLNLKSNIDLKILNTSLNLLTELDVEKNTQLSKVNVNSNYLKFLAFDNHSSLDSLSCDSNLIQKSNDANIPDGLVIHNAEELRFLSASDNNMSQVKISNNVELISLEIGGNQLNSIDVSNNKKLIQFYCDRNELDDLNLTNNKDLELLNCSYNQLNTLDVSNNLKLKEISVSDNSLTALDVNLNDKLTSLVIDNNQLFTIDLSQNPELQNLSIARNSLETLDVSSNHQLGSLQATSNSLKSIYLKNRNNADLKTLTLTSNPDLSCIEVDDASYADANEEWRKDDDASYSENCHYTDTYIPDDNFEQVLIDLGIDTGILDDYVAKTEIELVNTLDLRNRNISDLTGLEGFTNLENLDISSNQVDSLDVGSNQYLKVLITASNRIDALDVSMNKEITRLDVSRNNLMSMQLDSLNFLISFKGDFNDLNDLDISQNELLEELTCSSNQLNSLNLKNGNNSILSFLDATGNPDLTCIEIDDLNSVNPDWKKDDAASFSENCHYNEVYVPDDAFEQALIDAGYDYEGAIILDDYVPVEKMTNATSLDLSNEGIVDLTGLESFVNLGLLNIENNDVVILDISNNLKLRKLYCSNNQLTSLDINKNALLEELRTSSNSLTELDLSNNQLLRELNIDANPIADVELHYLPVLEIFNGSNTEITNLNLGDNTNLIKLRANNNMNLISVNIQSGYNEILESVNLQSNPLLNCILVDDKDAAYSNPNWIKDNTAGYKLICDDDDNDSVSNAEDLCPTTPFGDFVDLFGCSIFSLPIDNFNVIVTDETCNSRDNGKVNIESKEVYNFVATISNDNYSQVVNFGATTEIRNLKAGRYELCIKIAEREKYEACYEINITEPQDLSVFSNISESAGTAFFKMTGADKYIIDHNGLVFNTSNQDVSLSLTQGVNTIKVSTNMDCQGVYEKTIFYGDESVCYPNPFEDFFNLYVGETDLKQMKVHLFSSMGHMVLSQFVFIQNGSIQIDGSKLVSGVYSVYLELNTGPRYFKIVKI